MSRKRILTGNEAFARGAYEGGVVVGAAYPGTPSTEILENLALYPEINCNWSPNEKVALEVAAGASMQGGRALAVMKHVGVNVAADPLMTLSYTGVGGGLVVISADDPGMHSSQNEQDNRHYARLAKLPLLEPSDSKEARDYILAALDLSESYDTPVLVRSTTRISHSRGLVETGQRSTVKVKGFQKDPAKFVMLPGYARNRHVIVEKRMEKLRREAELSPLNKIEGSGKLGVICSGITYQYVKEASIEAAILKLGFSYPLPVELLRSFAAGIEKIIVVEELDPFLEEQILALNLGVPVMGKALFPPLGELGTEIIREKISGKKKTLIPVREEIPARPPVMCPGCSHRGVFYSLKKLKVNVTGDIGCYTLGALKPLEAMDSCICMGASIGAALGMEKADPAAATRTVAVIGDSTFLHSGITPLLDIIYSKAASTVMILDNSTTAMTGHQHHPGTGVTLQGRETKAVDLELLCRSIGVKRVTVIDPNNLKELQSTIKTELAAGEPSVIITRRPCVLLSKTAGRPYHVDKTICNGCSRCLKLGCPALSKDEEFAVINEAVCNGCGLCIQVCSPGAIKIQSQKEGDNRE